MLDMGFDEEVSPRDTCSPPRVCLLSPSLWRERRRARFDCRMVGSWEREKTGMGTLPRAGIYFPAGKSPIEGAFACEP